MSPSSELHTLRYCAVLTYLPSRLQGQDWAHQFQPGFNGKILCQIAATIGAGARRYSDFVDPLLSSVTAKISITAGPITNLDITACNSTHVRASAGRQRQR